MSDTTDQAGTTHESTQGRLLLIDGHSMAFRAFFALPADKFVNSAGQSTNAIYGFVAMMINLLTDERPTHVAVAFDTHAPTFRDEEYADYKGGRDATPEAFKDQVPLIAEVLRAAGIATLEKDGLEADDILATLAHEGSAAGMTVSVVSGDRDAFQLVDDRVTVLYPIKGVKTVARMTPAAVEEKYGVPPHRYPEIAALTGETADNLPGVPGVGPKTAAKWINQFDGLDNIVARVDEVPGKAGASLREHLADVLRNRKLNHLLTDADVGAALADLPPEDPDRGELTRLFDVLEFTELRTRLFAVLPDDGTAPEPDGPVLVVDSPEEGGLGAWLADRAGARLGLYVEGSGRPGRGEAVSLAIADADAHAVTVDLTEVAGDDEAALRAWLADADAPKSVHDAKAAWHALRGGGLELAGVTYDPALAGYIARPDARHLELADLATERLGLDLDPASGAAQGELDLSLEEGAAEEALARRAHASLALVPSLTGELEEAGGTGLLTDLELPVQRVLQGMEDRGIAVDTDYLDGLSGEFGAQVEDAAAAAYEAIDREVNLGSPKQLQEVLFDQLDMPRTKKTKTGYTTNADALEWLLAQTQHPFLVALLRHREQIKLRQTVDGLRAEVQDDRRIRTTFQQTVAATGRLSSKDPNLQNVPVRSEDGMRIRQAFVVSDAGESLMTADYSQIEMRIMAHLSGDEALIEAFRSGEDLHAFVASRVFGVEVDAVTAEQRRRIKAMSYGLAYGLSAFGLSQQLGVEVEEARSLMEGYFERFGGVRDYLRGVQDEARTRGYTATILGRRRYLPDLTSDNRQRRELAERIALNAPIQGSAADIIKVAMIRLDAEIAQRGLASDVLLQVHDELVLEVAPGEREEVEQVVRDTMGQAAELSVPLDVSVGVGRSWRDAAH
ncbi:DNA polymerase I [Georgenia sp. Z1344]|uniref:DNA polymerase I n=1 Tax=Georgenia sp. Z1344 TaxID=3416706 RepID=UPI003CF32C9D